MSDKSVGTGTIVEPSPYRDEDEQRDAELAEQIESIEQAEIQWAAWVREHAADTNDRSN